MIKPDFLHSKDAKRVNSPMKSSWIIPEIDDMAVSELSQRLGIEKALISILFSRGYKTPREIHDFLYPELTDMHSPFLMKDIYKAIHLIKKHINSANKIAVFADSDLDGITSLTILYDLLSKLGKPPIIRYPKDKEGYGLTCDIIQEFIDEGVNLLITVDSGIRDVEEIQMAVDNNIEVIITDHHEPDEILPKALIVNPKQKECPYPFKELAGVGVVFKLAHALLYSYINGFDNRFIVVVKQDMGFEFASLFNGYIEKQEAVSNTNLMQYLTNNIDEKDYFVLFDEDPEFIKLIKSFNESIRIKYIHEIYNGKLLSGTNDLAGRLNEIINLFKIRPDLCSSRIELACKIFQEVQMRSSGKIFSLLEQYLVLVTVGTIADIMPVYNENRQMIRYGISMLKRGEGHYGINSLLNGDPVNTKSISWGVAPLLNTPGRFGITHLTVDFFLEQNKETISKITAEIEKLNSERKKIVAEIICKAKERISDSVSGMYGNLFLYHDDEIIDGIAGLVANRIADDLKKPVIVATTTGDNGLLKGSGRSPGGFNFFSYVEPFADSFVKLGGHAQAFGFTIERENLQGVIDKISASIGDDLVIDKSLKADCRIGIDEISNAFLDRLDLLEPYGKNNEEPLFYASDVGISSFAIFGADKRHGKYVLSNGLTAIGWDKAPQMDGIFSEKKNAEIIFRLERNTYMNKTSPRLIIVDIS